MEAEALDHLTSFLDQGKQVRRPPILWLSLRGLVALGGYYCPEALILSPKGCPVRIRSQDEQRRVGLTRLTSRGRGEI